MRYIVDRIIEWFAVNPEVFEECMEELDAYEGYLDDRRYFDMVDLAMFLDAKNPKEILNMAFFGSDEDSHAGFNPNRAYFRFDGYGNLVSSDSKDYSMFLDHYAVEHMAENIDYIYGIERNEELKEMFDAYNALEDERIAA